MMQIYNKRHNNELYKYKQYNMCNMNKYNKTNKGLLKDRHAY